MVKHEVKINKANKQPFVNLSSKDEWKAGQMVEVSKSKVLTQVELKNWVEENKSKLEEVKKSLKDHFSIYDQMPLSKFETYLKLKYNIQEEFHDDAIDLTLNNTLVSYNPGGREMIDSTNYIDFDNLNVECSPAFKNEILGDQEGFSFNTEHLEKQNILEDSFKLHSYIKVLDTIHKENEDIENEILGDIDFKPYDWGGNVGTHDFHEVYKHIDLDIYILVPIHYDNKNSLIISNLERENTHEIEF